MTDVLEVAWCADISLRQLLLLAFGLLVLPAQAAVAQHVVDMIRLLMAMGVVESDIIDLRVLDVHCGHEQCRACFSLSSVEQVIDGGSESFGFFLTSEIQTHLTCVSCKRNEVGSGAADVEVVVEFLFKHDFPFLDVKHFDKVGSLRVVFDQAGHSTAPLHPVIAPVSPIHLYHCRTQGGAFPAQVAEQALVLLRGQQKRADINSHAGRPMAVHSS